MLAADLPIELVATDRKCRGLQIGIDAGIESVLLERIDFCLLYTSDAADE